MARHWTFLFILLLGVGVLATPFDICVIQAGRQEHRLNRFEALKDCFEKNKATLKMSACFQTVEKLKLSKESVELSEQLKSVCFYEVGSFMTVKSCLEKSQVFHSAINKDEAVFECYQSFKNELNTSQCLQISKLLKYPLKRDHLISQCYN